jgi:hypothetical protein
MTRRAEAQSHTGTWICVNLVHAMMIFLLAGVYLALTKHIGIWWMLTIWLVVTCCFIAFSAKCPKCETFLGAHTVTALLVILSTNFVPANHLNFVLIYAVVCWYIIFILFCWFQK